MTEDFLLFYSEINATSPLDKTNLFSLQAFVTLKVTFSELTAVGPVS